MYGGNVLEIGGMMDGSVEVGGLIMVGMPNFLRVAAEFEVRQTEGRGAVLYITLGICGDCMGLV